jgi:hypothetical protein
MTVLRALFGKPVNPRKTLRSIAVTTPSGRTIVIPEQFLVDQHFIEKSSKLEKLADRIVPLRSQAAQ